jgi:hypothetical protein
MKLSSSRTTLALQNCASTKAYYGAKEACLVRFIALQESLTARLTGIVKMLSQVIDLNLIFSIRNSRNLQK